MKKDDQILIIDFDSTFVAEETLECLSELALKNNTRRKEILSEVSDITRKGMEGEISFAESLDRRLKLFKAHKDHVDQLSELLHHRVTPSIKRNKSFFINNSHRIYIISGGFMDYMCPVLNNYGIDNTHIFANEFTYNKSGRITGYDKTNILSQKQGKVKKIRDLNLSKEVIAIGDGITDWEIKKYGLANIFIAYTENITRTVVCENCDLKANNFEEVLKILNS